jgi:outer membrane protein assembly factor BamA
MSCDRPRTPSRNALPGAHPCDTRRVRTGLVTLTILLGLASMARAEAIADIVVGDNTKTRSETVILIAKIDVGDDWTTEMGDQIKRRLVSSGLFKDVEVFWDEMPLPAHGVRVHILVKDKHSWIIAPAFYNQPTNIGGGVGYGENNLFGQNQKLLLYGQIATGDSFFIGAWVIPSILGSRFHAQVDTYLADSRNFEYASPGKYLDNPKQVRESRLIYLNAGLRLGIDLPLGIKLDTRLRGAHVHFSKVGLVDGATIEDVTGDPTSDPSQLQNPGKDGWDVSNELDLGVDHRANWYGVQTGYSWKLSYEYSVAALGSDFHYKEFGASAFRAWQVLDRHNLILKSSFNYGYHLPFQQEYTMGGTSMRGWLNNQFRGDLKAQANLEYSLPLFTIYGLGVRGLGFFDSGYTTFVTADSNSERNYLPNAESWRNSKLAPFKNSVGVGTRLYLRQIVLPLLGVDFGYGLEARDFQIYLAIGLTD